MNKQIPTNKVLVGIRREDKSYWERRVVLVPEHTKEIMDKHSEIQFIVQPSDRRIFSDSEYENAGCIIFEDLSVCSLILGVKEIPPSKLMPHKTYMFFSHTIKAQTENMPTLDHMLKNKIRMLDYEKITNQKGGRMVAFGRFAGIAGAIDYLAGLGQYLLQMGYSTPFLRVSPSYKYFNLQQAYEHIKQVGSTIQQLTIPEELQPMVFAITGKGRCSLGAMEVIENLPIKVVSPNELEGICKNKASNPFVKTHIFVCYIETEHMVAPKNPSATFNKQEYYKNPETYKPIFAEKYLPYISSIFHNMYWDQRFPRLISCEELRNLWKSGQKKLIGIGDVTCDYEGSIEFLRKFTTPDEPFWVYNPVTEHVVDGVNYQQDSILYQSLDFLPCELANDASTHFSNILKDWIHNIATSDIDVPYEKCTLLPHVKNAMITLDGQLTPNFKYITLMRQDKERQLKLSEGSESIEQIQDPADKSKSLFESITLHVKILLNGHLFLNNNINTILDTCQDNGVSFNIVNLQPGTEEAKHSSLVLFLNSNDSQKLRFTLEKMCDFCANNEISVKDMPLSFKSREQSNAHNHNSDNSHNLENNNSVNFAKQRI